MLKRLANATAVVLTATLLLVFSVAGAARNLPNSDVDVKTESGERNPWTNLELNNRPGTFQFAVVSDRTGGHRPGVFNRAVQKINMLQPEFVMSVGDLIEGYSEDPGQWALEWAEFQTKLDNLQMPFFLTPGNHDLSNVPMRQEWVRKFGRSYYHFVYKNCLFVVLNSEDEKQKDDPYNFSPAQQQWLSQLLAQNADVRWTFVFFHKPAWNHDDVDPAKLGFAQIERSLQGRKYTVFVGHEHHYAKYVRHGREYFMLATTGGGSQLRGTSYGEFDHVAWVTMREEAPIIANVMLDGVVANDVRTERDLPKNR